MWEAFLIAWAVVGVGLCFAVPFFAVIWVLNSDWSWRNRIIFFCILGFCSLWLCLWIAGAHFT